MTARPPTETRAVRIGAALVAAGTVVAWCGTGWALALAVVALWVGVAVLFGAGIVTGRWAE